MTLHDTSESLTLDSEALERAANMLGTQLDGGDRRHFCAEWQEDDGCTICWAIAAEVLRAAEGLRKCSRCNGMGMVGSEGDCCPQCGGDGLELISPPPIVLCPVDGLECVWGPCPPKHCQRRVAKASK